MREGRQVRCTAQRKQEKQPAASASRPESPRFGQLQMPAFVCWICAEAYAQARLVGSIVEVVVPPAGEARDSRVGRVKREEERCERIVSSERLLARSCLCSAD